MVKKIMAILFPAPCRLSNRHSLSPPIYIYMHCSLHPIATQTFIPSSPLKNRKADQQFPQSKTMSSSASANNLQKTCGICSVAVTKGHGQAVFSGECSHDFHYPCISSYISNGNRTCPVCFTRWNNVPSVAPPPNPFTFVSPFQPTYVPTPTYLHPLIPEPVPEPISFDDDDALLEVKADDDPMSIDSNQKVTIKSIPERKAVASSESVSPFAVLVSLKAPSLSDGVRSSQRAPIDIVTVLDVSGSMWGNKLDLVKKAVHFVIENLSVSDRLSIVSFSNQARRVLPLRMMTESGREEAKRAVDSLMSNGGTNIVEGLRKGARVLEERKYKNPVNSIIFLSDGQDTYSLKGFQNSINMNMLPPSISPRNEEAATIPVHSFGFGSDHDPVTMHAISDASGGTFSFIESHEMVQDAFAGCIGGLLSIVTQELRLKLRSASHGVEIKSIPSGRYRSEVTNQGTEGVINVGELYADEEKEFLINLSIPVASNEGEDSSRKTSVLDITCSYKESITKQTVVVEGDLVEILRPQVPSPQDLTVNLEVDRQRNRLRAAESIQQAQQMAEAGNHAAAKKLLAEKRNDMMATASAQAGDGLTRWLEGEMRETEMRIGSARVYQQSGRAFALAGMSSHASQRATTRGGMVAGAAAPPPQAMMGVPCAASPFSTPFSGGSLVPESAAAPAFGASGALYGAPPPGAPAAFFRGYATPQMANMVTKSMAQSKGGQGEGKTSN